MNKNIATAYVKFLDIPGGKRRPVFVIRDNQEKLFFFDITSKYESKSENMKKWYFEIQDYVGTGLKKHSWIDTFKMYSLKKDSTDINYIGRLSNNDTLRLRLFIEKIHR